MTGVVGGIGLGLIEASRPRRESNQGFGNWVKRVERSSYQMGRNTLSALAAVVRIDGDVATLIVRVCDE